MSSCTPPSINNCFKNRSSILLGLTPEEAANKYGSELTQFELAELKNFQYIYDVGTVRINLRI